MDKYIDIVSMFLINKLKIMTNGNDAAHPTLEQNGNERWNTEYGLTKREHFAAIAMQGLLSNPEWMIVFKSEKFLMQPEIIAETSLKAADALITQLNQ